jgi:hypothetical protein
MKGAGMKAIVGVAAAVALAGCSVNIGGPDQDPTFGQLRCDAGRAGSGMVVLLAQSVRGIDAVPCLRMVPQGWAMQAFDPRDGRSHIKLNDMTDDSITFEADVVDRCDRAGAAESPTDHEGLRRYDRSARGAGTRYQVYRYYETGGGCVAFHFDGGGRHADETAEDIMSAFGFITRAEIDRAIARNSGGRLHLDPS